MRIGELVWVITFFHYKGAGCEVWSKLMLVNGIYLLVRGVLVLSMAWL